MKSRLLPPGRLSPPTIKGMPLPGALKKPSMEAGNIETSTSDDLEKLSDQAKSFIKKTGDLTSEMVAHHGPKMKQKVQDLSASTAVYAKNKTKNFIDAAQHEREKMEDPDYARKQKNRLLKGGMIGLGVFGGLFIVVWFAAEKHATSEAQAYISNYIAQNGLGSYVTYKSVSASPFGDITINGITVSDGSAVDFKVASAEISDITKVNGQVVGGAIALHGFNIPLSSFFQTIGSYAPDIHGLGWLQTLAYTNLTGNMDLSVEPLSGGKYQIKSSGKLHDLGGWSTNIIFGNAQNYVDALVQGENLSAASVSEMEGVSLIKASITLNNGPLLRRSSTLTTQASPWDKKSSMGYNLDIGQMVQDGLSRDQALAISSKINDWLENGDELMIKTNIDQPLSLFGNSVQQAEGIISGLLGQGDNGDDTIISSPESFLAMSKADVSVSR